VPKISFNIDPTKLNEITSIDNNPPTFRGSEHPNESTRQSSVREPHIREIKTLRARMHNKAKARQYVEEFNPCTESDITTENQQ
jgi:hypothetical protein